MSVESHDLIIVGAGPAGISAAKTAAARGLDTLVLDEYPRPGGRLLGQLHQEPDGTWWNGIREARELVRQAVEAGAVIRTGVSVTTIEQGEDKSWNVWTNEGILRARLLLLATGAAESAAPLPGWTLPGVMSIGAAQVMTNVQRVRVGNRGVVIGMNVLAMAIVSELRLAGIELAAIVLPPRNPLTDQAAVPLQVLESLLRFAHLAPSPLFRLGAGVMKRRTIRKAVLKFYPKRGMRLLKTPLQLRRAAIEILGVNSVTGVKVMDLAPSGDPIPGSEKVIEADFVCIAGGLYPLAELAAVAGVPFRYLPELGGHVPVHDEQMRTPLQGLYVAGNITGVESAKVAISQGQVAGLAISIDSASPNAPDRAELREAVRQVVRTRQEALIQFHPGIAEGRERLYAAASLRTK